jgi:hypothetical protein
VALTRGGYFPGVATAVVLLGLAVYLAVEMARPAAETGGAATA